MKTWRKVIKHFNKLKRACDFMVAWFQVTSIAAHYTTKSKRYFAFPWALFFRWNYLWWVSSSSEPIRLLDWWEENTASGQGSFRERSPFGSRFSESLFLDVPGTATEQVRTCGFRRNSSSLNKAPKKHDTVLLNSFESFLVTFPSISSET